MDVKERKRERISDESLQLVHFLEAIKVRISFTFLLFLLCS